MTIQRMIELLVIEHECVLRNSHGDCDRKCAICELAQNDIELLEMYANVISLLKAHFLSGLVSSEMDNYCDGPTLRLIDANEMRKSIKGDDGGHMRSVIEEWVDSQPTIATVPAKLMSGLPEWWWL